MGERLPTSQNSYVCNFSDCKATFSKSWKLNAHLCKHTGLRPFSCENCPKSFCTQYRLTRHGLSHSGEKSHKCLAEACSEVFATHSTMKKHMASVHQHQRKRYECDHLGCEKYFNKKYKLTAHKAEHDQTQPFFCTFKGCLKAFSSVCKLRRHQKVHKGYACEEVDCDFQGKTWTELQNHRREHTIKLQCSDCKKLFANAWFLDQHQLNVHSGEKRVFPCPNEGCEKIFTSRFNLQSHILGDHECKKPFSCAYSGCGKSFTMKESLWRHGVVHDPLKRKIEKLCPKKNQPWRKEVGILATRLHNTNLMDTDP